MALARAHVLAFPFPAQGHINPMMLLCRRLASMGVVITFLNTRRRHEQQFNQSNAAGDDNFRFMSIEDDCLPTTGGNLQIYLKAMEEGMQEDFERIVEELINDPLRPRLTCVIFDSFVDWISESSRKFGLCGASLWTSSVASLLLCLRICYIQHILPAAGRSDMIDFVPGLPPFSAKDLPSSVQREDKDDPGFKRRIRRYENMRNHSWVFVNSFLEMEAELLTAIREENPNTILVGPLHHMEGSNPVTTNSNAPWSEDVSCLEWLDKQAPRSVVYVAFGSIAGISCNEAEEIYKGLDSSGHAFLWVVRPDAQDEALDKLLDVMRQNKRGLIISWAPQIQVLEHEAVGVFVTHCGWNSTFESIVAGVPMLCRPNHAEQHFNCVFAVEHWKVGVRLQDGKGEVCALHVEEVVRFVMGDEGAAIRNRVRELSRAAKQAIQPGGSSDSSLADFLAALKSLSTK